MIRSLQSLLAAASLLALVIVPAQSHAVTGVICIDPGHGGTDPGGTGFSLRESDVVLDTSLRFRDYLNADTANKSGGGDWTVHLTRDTDVYIALSGRTNYCNSKNATRFMSIHSNAFSDPSANGTETFSYQNGTTGANLRDRVQEEMIKAWGLRNRGSKTAGFYVIANSAAPAILSELAFITNAAENAILKDPVKRKRAALAHLYGLQRHMGLSAFDPGSSGGGTTDAGVADSGGGTTDAGAADTGGGVKTGVLTGVVYTDGDTNKRVAGATVKLNTGQSTVSTEGAWKFDLPPGTYTVTVEKPGYQTGSVTRTVTAGQTTWGSVEIKRVVTPTGGRLKGLVFNAVVGESARIPGASVLIKETGDTQNATADGVFDFGLPAGTYTIRAEAAGYQPLERSAAVVAGTDKWANMGLNPIPPADTTPPKITITNPKDGSTVKDPSMNITGEVDDPTVTEVEVNGRVVPVSGKKFAITLVLNEGGNTINVTARDAAGNEGKASVSVTYEKPVVDRKGTIDGLVYDGKEGKGKPLGGVPVLIAGGVSTTTDPQGRFSFRVDPGDYLVRTQPVGYLEAEEQITVPPQQSVFVELAPEPRGGGADTEPPTVKIEFPIDGQTLPNGQFTVSGVVNDNNAVTGVEVNGIPATVSGIKFTVEMDLPPGSTNLTATAADLAGNTGTDAVQINIEAPPAPEPDAGVTLDAEVPEKDSGPATFADGGSKDVQSNPGEEEDLDGVLQDGKNGGKRASPGKEQNFVSGDPGGCGCDIKPNRRPAAGMWWIAGLAAAAIVLRRRIRQGC
ncbi:MAG: hypothetical protein GMKNLPBB_00558 [Myxococcota bacterium]|nr:hypothetical protein [Myxococcota bacterium]